jgi:tetratricopeptide (TPR) repeat protein
MRLVGATVAVAFSLSFQAVAAQSAPAPSSAPADAISRGVAAFTARDPATALREFEDALQVDSTNYQANWRAALALINLGMETPDGVKSPQRDSLYARAERYARRAVQADSTKADGYFILANALGRTALTKGKSERIRLATQIRDASLRAIDLDPSHDGAYHVLGRWNAEIMRLSGLSRFLAKSFMGASVFKQASWDNAIANLERAVELDPKRIFHRLDLATIYADRKRYASARAQIDTLETLPIRDYLDPRYKEEAAALRQKIAGKKGDS